MNVTVTDAVIELRHQGHGTAADAELLCSAMLEHARSISESGRRPAILHDTEELISASREYAHIFARAFTELGTCSPLNVAQIRKSHLRILARLAMSLSGTKIRIFRTRGECIHYLQGQGYSIVDAPGSNTLRSA